jgi:hypothetical protein
MPVGAGGAFTGGLKLLPPVGLMLFSVGETDGDVLVGVVVLDGDGVSPPPQAVSAPIETNAAMPRPAATRRVRRLFMMLSNLRCWETLRSVQTALYRPELGGVKTK